MAPLWTGVTLALLTRSSARRREGRERGAGGRHAGALGKRERLQADQGPGRGRWQARGASGEGPATQMPETRGRQCRSCRLPESQLCQLRHALPCCRPESIQLGGDWFGVPLVDCQSLQGCHAPQGVASATCAPRGDMGRALGKGCGRARQMLLPPGSRVVMRAVPPRAGARAGSVHLMSHLRLAPHQPGPSQPPAW